MGGVILFGPCRGVVETVLLVAGEGADGAVSTFSGWRPRGGGPFRGELVLADLEARVAYILRTFEEDERDRRGGVASPWGTAGAQQVVKFVRDTIDGRYDVQIARRVSQDRWSMLDETVQARVRGANRAGLRMLRNDDRTG